MKYLLCICLALAASLSAFAAVSPDDDANAVQGNWKPFQTLKAELTVDRPSVAYFRIYQGKPDGKPQQPRWEKTMTLLPGRNEVTLLIRHGIGSMDPEKGDITSFIIGMFRPEKGQSLLVGKVRLSADWPPPKVLGWYSPYNWRRSM